MTSMFLVSSCSRLCPVHWSQVLSREWSCSWSNADRQCSNYTWVINYFIAYLGSSYIRCLTIYQSRGRNRLTKRKLHSHFALPQNTSYKNANMQIWPTCQYNEVNFSGNDRGQKTNKQTSKQTNKQVAIQIWKLISKTHYASSIWQRVKRPTVAWIWRFVLKGWTILNSKK